MKIVKSLILYLVFMSFYCANVFAMHTLLEQSSRHIMKRNTSCSVSKRFSSNKLDFEINMKKYKYKNKILETSIIPKNKPEFYDLPANFFIENRENVTVENVNERIFHVHREMEMEKESSINIDDQYENKKR